MGKSKTPTTTSGIKRGPWTPQEDKKLVAFIQQNGHGCWRSLPLKAGLQRCGKSCRLRWRNYLNPDIKRGSFSLQEDQTIIRLHALLGNRWSTIAANLPRRTDNEIKNYWNSHLKKRLTMIGFDPVTHKPKTAILASANGGDPKNLSHIAQWESARLQAEARFARQSKLLLQPSPQCYNFNLTTWETLMMSNTIAAVGSCGGGGEEGGTVGGATNFVGNVMSSFADLDAVLGNISGSRQFESTTPTLITSTSTVVPDFNELSEETGTNNEYGDLWEALQLQQGYNVTGFDEDVVDVMDAAWTYLEQCNDISAYHHHNATMHMS